MYKMRYLSDRIKLHIFQAVAVSVLLYRYTTWTLTKSMKKNPDGNYTRILHAVLNKSKKKHSTKQQLCSHIAPISLTIQVKTEHAEKEGKNHKRRHGLHMNVPVLADPAKIYIHQHFADVGWTIETDGDRLRTL